MRATKNSIPLAAAGLLLATATAIAVLHWPGHGVRILFHIAALIVLAAWCIGYQWIAATTEREQSKGWDRKVEEHLAIARQERLAKLLSEHDTPPFEPTDKERTYVLASLNPAIVLHNLVAARAVYEKHFHDGRIINEIHLDRTGGGNIPRSDIARLEAHKIARQTWLEADPAFRLAVTKLQGAGISCEFGGQGDACGEFAVLRLSTTAQCLPKLEALAADDAGYDTPAEREHAAERFRIYMLRNYGDDWQRNRELYPDVGGSPYSNPRFWSKST